MHIIIYSITLHLMISKLHFSAISSKYTVRCSSICTVFPRLPLRYTSFSCHIKKKSLADQLKSHELWPKLYDLSLTHSNDLSHQTFNFHFINGSTKMYVRWDFDLCTYKIFYFMVYWKGNESHTGNVQKEFWEDGSSKVHP